jgi:tripartite-type tricarboxylate transporter receptor subunit TctC
MMQRLFVPVLALITMGALSPLAATADFPAKPVELIVPWAAGGRADLIGRVFAASAGKHLRQQMVVVNKPGGGGTTGTVTVVNAPADGHTLLMATIGGNVMRPLSTSVPYRYDSFAPVGQISASTIVLATRADRPWKNLAELVTDAKKRASPPTFSCPFGVVPHLAMIAVARRGGVELKIVPQQGDSQSVTAVLGGHVDMIIASPAALLPHLKTGAMRALATFGETRDPVLADVPTATEQGFPVVATPWTGIAAPRGTPPEVLARLRQVFEAVMKDPEFVAAMDKLGERVTPIVGEAFGARWKLDHEQWEEPAKAVRK